MTIPVQFDSTLSWSVLLEVAVFVVLAIVGWTRIEMMSKQNKMGLKDVSQKSDEVARKADEQAELTFQHREAVMKAMHETALVNATTVATLSGIAKQVDRHEQQLAILTAHRGKR